MLWPGYFLTFSPCLIESPSKWIIGGWNQNRKSEKLNWNFRIAKAKFSDWDNEELKENENVKEGQEELIHPDVISEIPGVEQESDYENTVEPALFDDVDTVNYTIEQTAAAK